MSLHIPVSATDLMAGDELDLARESALESATVEVASRFARPAGLVGLATSVMDATRHGMRVSVDGARGGSLNDYLAAAGLYTFLSERGAEVADALLSLTPHYKSLLPLRWVVDQAGIEDVEAHLTDELREFDLALPDIGRATGAVREALLHAIRDRSVAAVCSAERYADPNGWVRIEAAIGDLGPALSEQEWQLLEGGHLMGNASATDPWTRLLARLARHIISEGSGSLEVRSRGKMFVTSTRAGRQMTKTRNRSGLQLAFMVNSASNN